MGARLIEPWELRKARISNDPFHYSSSPQVIRPTGDQITEDTLAILKRRENDLGFRHAYDVCLQESGIDESKLGTLPPGTVSPCAEKALKDTGIKK